MAVKDSRPNPIRNAQFRQQHNTVGFSSRFSFVMMMTFKNATRTIEKDLCWGKKVASKE